MTRRTAPEHRMADYRARDAGSLLAAMRSLIPPESEWKDYENEADFGNVLLELFAHMGDILSYYQDAVARESFLTTARTRAAVMRHLDLIGYRLATATPAEATLEVAVPDHAELPIVVKRGAAFATTGEGGLPVVRFEYAASEALEIHEEDLERPDGDGVRVFELPVIAGRWVADEVLGEASGAPNQAFRLQQAGAVVPPIAAVGRPELDLVVRLEGGGVPPAPWTRRSSFAFSEADSRDYVVEVDEQDNAIVHFGDGERGQVPAEGATVVASYRTEGGEIGNLPAGSITKIVSANGLDAAKNEVSNPRAATGGAERESIEHAVRVAPRAFRSLGRAVTLADHEALAASVAGVAKVRAARSAWHDVVLTVAPSGGGAVSDALRAALLGFFEDKRSVGAMISVADPVYVPIRIAAEIRAASYYDAKVVRRRVTRALEELLAFDNVGFGEVIYLSRLYDAVDAVEGVEASTITAMARTAGHPTGGPFDLSRLMWHEPPLLASGVLRLEDDEIPVAAEVTVSIAVGGSS